MNLNKGFTLTETLISLVVFSLILSLYIPAFTSELQRIEEMHQQNARWDLFERLVAIHNTQPELVDPMMERFNRRYDQQATTFMVHFDRYELHFDDLVLSVTIDAKRP